MNYSLLTMHTLTITSEERLINLEKKLREKRNLEREKRIPCVVTTEIQLTQQYIKPNLKQKEILPRF